MSQRSAEYFSVKEWFYKWGFKSVWDVIWRPLFQLKFDQDADAISLVWLWGKLHTRGTSRKKGAEVLGYLPGSFGRVALVLQDRIRELGGTILLNTSVHKVIPIQDRFSVETSDGVITADRVISTQSADILATTADWSPAYKSQLLGLRYKAAICMMIISSHPWLDRYWVNIGDDGRPFGGMIAHTNLVSSDDYGGKHILYLSRYLDETNPLFQASNDDLIALFCEGVHSIIPEFDRNQVDDIKVFRQRNAQPVVPKGYQNPSVATEIPGFDWISTHHTYPFDRGMNYAVQLANQYSA
jgi:protoporphyrinogen oxidase